MADVCHKCERRKAISFEDEHLEGLCVYCAGQLIDEILDQETMIELEHIQCDVNTESRGQKVTH